MIEEGCIPVKIFFEPNTNLYYFESLVVSITYQDKRYDLVKIRVDFKKKKAYINL